MTLLPHLSFWAELLVFLISAGIIWIAGKYLSDSTDVLSDRLHLGQALGGLILLAVATNLPEIAITYTAAVTGHLDVAVSNILGGIAIQTVVLVALDAFGVRERRPLTYQAASLTLVLEGAVVLAVLLAVVMGTQLPKTLVHFRLSPDVVLIALIWLVGLVLTQRATKGLPWKDSGEAPDSHPERGHSPAQNGAGREQYGENRDRVRRRRICDARCRSTRRRKRHGGCGADRSVRCLIRRDRVSGSHIAAELSTGITATRQGDYKLAFGDIFGGNAFLPVLFLLATVVSGKAVLPNAHPADLYLTGRGGLLTVVYILGLLFRPRKEYARLGIDSIAVLVIYVAGVIGSSPYQNKNRGGKQGVLRSRSIKNVERQTCLTRTQTSSRRCKSITRRAASRPQRFHGALQLPTGRDSNRSQTSTGCTTSALACTPNHRGTLHLMSGLFGVKAVQPPSRRSIIFHVPVCIPNVDEWKCPIDIYVVASALDAIDDRLMLVRFRG